MNKFGPTSKLCYLKVNSVWGHDATISYNIFFHLKETNLEERSENLYNSDWDTVNNQSRCSEDDIEKFEKCFQKSRKRSDIRNKKEWLTTEFSNIVGNNELILTIEEMENGKEKNIVYKLQRECHLNGLKVCKALELEETGQIWKALSFMSKTKQNLKLVVVGDGDEGKWSQWKENKKLLLI